MRYTVRQIVKSIVPPVIVTAARGIKRFMMAHPQVPEPSTEAATPDPPSGYHGDYDSWESAVASAQGYDAQIILDIQSAAMRQVRDGKAAYERDSVLFDEVILSHPMLSALLYAASRSDGLSVLDFGGALGSSYFQNRDLLKHLPRFRWQVVEQPHFVTLGKKEFCNQHLGFSTTIEEAWSYGAPDVVLLSSVLQYLPDPWATLKDIVFRRPRFILIDRTLVLDSGPECIMVQTVPPSIYPASYACRIFAEEDIKAAFRDGYQLRFAFDAVVGGPIAVRDGVAQHRGYFYERRD